MVHGRFDRDQHELLVRQMLHIRQTSTASEYITRFTSLNDQLLAYNKAIDPVYFVTRFIDGLRPELRSILLVQLPKTLDTACTLALLSEEAGANREVSHSSTVQFSKIVHVKGPYKDDQLLELVGDLCNFIFNQIIHVKGTYHDQDSDLGRNPQYQYLCETERLALGH